MSTLGRAAGALRAGSGMAGTRSFSSGSVVQHYTQPVTAASLAPVVLKKKVAEPVMGVFDLQALRQCVDNFPSRAYSIFPGFLLLVNDPQEAHCYSQAQQAQRLR